MIIICSINCSDLPDVRHKPPQLTLKYYKTSAAVSSMNMHNTNYNNMIMNVLNLEIKKKKSVYGSLIRKYR